MCKRTFCNLLSDVQISGLSAERMAVWIAQSLIPKILNLISQQEESPPIWLERLAQQSSSIVSRTLLQTKESYRQYIDDLAQNGQVTVTSEVSQRLDDMPKHIWVSEITLPHLYTGNKHKLGDVIIRANATNNEHRERKSFELAWFPGAICFGPNSNYETFSWSVRDHVPLIRKETVSLLEW